MQITNLAMLSTIRHIYKF